MHEHFLKLEALQKLVEEAQFAEDHIARQADDARQLTAAADTNISYTGADR